MEQVMRVLCDGGGKPRVKIHGLRMMSPRIVPEFPFASVDSTNIARNIGVDCRWKGTYTPINKQARALILRERIENVQSSPMIPPTHDPNEALVRGDSVGLDRPSTILGQIGPDTERQRGEVV